MKNISKYPFETLVLFVIFYFVGVVFFIESTSLWNKIVFFLITIGIVFVLFIISYTFSSEMAYFRKVFFGAFLTGAFQKKNFLFKLFYIVKLSFVPFCLATLLEFLLTFLFTDAGVITVGFPLPFYSFTAERFLFLNMFTNIFVFSGLIYFLGSVITRYPDITDI